MEHWNKVLLSLLLSAAYLSLWGQVNRYMVFFKDKANTSYSVESPEDFLSSRALERREKHGISITEQDLPVNSDYVSGMEALGVPTYFTTKWLNGVLVQTTEERIGEVQSLDFVISTELVAPGGRLTVAQESPATANPTEEVSTQGLTTNFQLDMLGIPTMHAEGFFGQNVLVAVMDGGFLGVESSSVFSHLHEGDQVVFTRDFVTDGFNAYQYSTHGTSVMSCLAGFVTNELSGGAYEADYALFVTEDVSSEYRIEEYNWLFAAEAADSMGVDIINTSLGYTDFDDPEMNYETADMDGETAVISRASQIAFSKGMALITSAGNLGDNSNWRFVSAPADAENVLAVGAVDANLTRAGLSSIGPTSDNRIKPDVMAMGQNTTVFSNNRYRQGSGTSFAAPLVSALAAGLLSANGDWTNQDLIDHLRNSGSMAQNPDNQMGYGIPNYAINRPDLILSTQLRAESVLIYPNPLTPDDDLIVEFERPAQRIAQLINTKGQVLEEIELQGQSSEINLRQHRSGLYFLKIEGEEYSSTFRIIKE